MTDDLQKIRVSQNIASKLSDVYKDNLPVDRASIISVNGSIHVPNREGYVFVRFFATESVDQVFCDKVHPAVDLPVIVRQLDVPPFHLYVDDIDRFILTFSGIATKHFLQKHGDTHEWGSSDVVDIFLRALVPFRTEPHLNVSVLVNPFPYVFNEVPKFFLGTVLDLTSFQPPLNQKRWVYLGLDPALNSLAPVSGSTVSDVDTLEAPFPVISDKTLPSALVLLHNQTKILESDIKDIRDLFSSGSFFVSQKHNLDASRYPNLYDDSSEGYAPLSFWVMNRGNHLVPLIFLCTDSTINNAVWRLISSAGYFTTGRPPSSFDNSSNGFFETAIWIDDFDLTDPQIYICVASDLTSASWKLLGENAFYLTSSGLPLYVNFDVSDNPVSGTKSTDSFGSPVFHGAKFSRGISTSVPVPLVAHNINGDMSMGVTSTGHFPVGFVSSVYEGLSTILHPFSVAASASDGTLPAFSSQFALCDLIVPVNVTFTTASYSFTSPIKGRFLFYFYLDDPSQVDRITLSDGFLSVHHRPDPTETSASYELLALDGDYPISSQHFTVQIITNAATAIYFDYASFVSFDHLTYEAFTSVSDQLAMLGAYAPPVVPLVRADPQVVDDGVTLSLPARQSTYVTPYAASNNKKGTLTFFASFLFGLRPHFYEDRSVLLSSGEGRFLQFFIQGARVFVNLYGNYVSFAYYAGSPFVYAGSFIQLSHTLPHSFSRNVHHHFALAFSDSDRFVGFYVDGALVDSRSGASYISPPIGPHLTLGMGRGGDTFYEHPAHSIAFDELCVFDDRLSDSDIAGLAASTSPINPDDFNSVRDLVFSLSDLSDVHFPSPPLSNQILSYSSSLSRWTSSTNSLLNLSDTVFPVGVSGGDYLVFNDTLSKWSTGRPSTQPDFDLFQVYRYI